MYFKLNIRRYSPISHFHKIVNIMRLSLVLCMLTIFCASATVSYSQVNEISLHLEDATLEQALEAIKQQSEYSFWYRNDEINLGRKVSVNINNQNIANVLDRLLATQGLAYTINEKHIVIYKTNEKASHPMITDNKKITGKVTDEKNEPIIGANVVVKGSTTGTITDMDGNFTLEVPDQATLLVSYIGYTPKEVAVKNQNNLSIMMIEDSKTIDEVVVIGYGSVKKSNLTGAVSSVKTTEIQQTPMTSIDQGLVGRASGVQVTQTSGMPGAVASIRVRGSSSLQGGNEPLYVIDGFPVYSGTGFGSTGGNTQISGLSTVNPSDIESIEILKDASATAIYGARAANGVVLITTKSGKKGRDIITFESSFGVQNVAKTIDVMNAQEYAALVNEAYTNDGLDAPYNTTQLGEIAKLGNGTNWQDEIFRPAMIQSYQLTFSGGDNKTTYAISGGYFDQKGVIINSDFKRYSLRLNFDRQIFNTLKVGTHMSGTHTISRTSATDVGGRDGVVNGALKMNPIQSVYANEETGEYTPTNDPGLLIPNPVATAKEEIYNNATTRVLGDVYAEWEFLKDLKLKVSLGMDIMYLKQNKYTPSNIYQSLGIASAKVGVNRSINWLNENILTWNKTFKDIHSLNILGGFTIQRNNVESVTGASSNFVNDVMKYNNLGAGSIYDKPESSATQWSLMSYLARINYSLYDRYLFSVNGRVDGSSRFGGNNKYGFFPSGSVAWRISEEGFMEPVKAVISNLKLRTSYGFTGNTEIGVYESLATLGSNSWTIGNQLVSGFYPNRIPNPDLKWEKTGQFDIGFDLGLFNNRLRLTADYYYKKTTDLFTNVDVSPINGITSYIMNNGDMLNKGFSISLNGYPVKTKNFRWYMSTYYSVNLNKVQTDDARNYNLNDYLNGTAVVSGQPISTFYSYKFLGLNPQNGAPMFDDWEDRWHLLQGKTLDEVVPMILVNSGTRDPKFSGDLNNTFTYKNWRLSLNFSYSLGSKVRLFEMYGPIINGISAAANVREEFLDRWQVPGDEKYTVYPLIISPSSPDYEHYRLHYSAPQRAVGPNSGVPAFANNVWQMYDDSDLRVVSGNYLKLQSLSFSYRLNDRLLRKTPFTQLSISFNTHNCFTISAKELRGQDPSQAGFADAGLSIRPSYTIGLNVSF